MSPTNRFEHKIPPKLNSFRKVSGQVIKHACSFGSFQLAQRTTTNIEDSLAHWTIASQSFFLALHQHHKSLEQDGKFGKPEVWKYSEAKASKASLLITYPSVCLSSIITCIFSKQLFLYYYYLRCIMGNGCGTHFGINPKYTCSILSLLSLILSFFVNWCVIAATNWYCEIFSFLFFLFFSPAFL